VKKAGLQRSVPTNRNCIPRHNQVGEVATLTEALQVRLLDCVDAAGIDRRINVLPGEVSVLRDSIREVSRGRSSRWKRAVSTTEDSHVNEGPNVKLFPMRLGGLAMLKVVSELPASPP
jgi:hypothetical protein